MVKKRNTMNEEIDGFEDEFETPLKDRDDSHQCLASNIRPLAWALLVASIIVICFLIFGKNTPDTAQLYDDSLNPSNAVELFPKGPATMGQAAAWQTQGGFITCPQCGWQGNRCKVNSRGNPVCPRCSYCPSPARNNSGITVAAVTSASQSFQVIKKLGMDVVNTPHGVMIHSVYKNSFAQQGGLRSGDIIVSFDRAKPLRVKELIAAVDAAPPEKRVTVKVYRSGKNRKLSVMVGEGEMEGVIMPSNSTVTATPVAGNPFFCQRSPSAPATKGNYLVCSHCGFRVLQQNGMQPLNTGCPRCGTMMVQQ